ncbi:MAG: ATP-binding protein [Ferruginibacter sp.]
MDKLPQEIAIIIFLSLFFLIIVIGIINLVLVYQKRQLHYLKEQEHLKIRFQNELLETQIEIQEQTFKAISQEIHDNIGQVLSLVKLNLYTLPPIPDPSVQEKVDSTKDLVSKVITDLRDISRSLYGDRIKEIGLRDAIVNELKILQNTGRYATSLDIIGTHYKLDPQKEMIIFRILQEAINNSIKHAHAKKISVQLYYGPENFILKISDDGIGFNAQQNIPEQEGIGLRSMENRSRLIGASWKVESSPGNGTLIIIELKQESEI